MIVLGSIPLIIFGYFFYSSGLIENLRNLKVIAWTTLIFGILLFIADRSTIKNKINNNLNLKNILIIGFFQMLAIIPGVSRSGIVITASRFLNFDRVDSSKISFYLSIPALAGASVLSMKDIINTNIDMNFLFIFAVLLSFVFSYLTIKYFLIYVRNFNLNLFVYYRTFLALILFVIAYSLVLVLGEIWEEITATNIKKHPIILFVVKNWLRIIHPAIAANTPSNEKIMAAGAGVMFFWA